MPTYASPSWPNGSEERVVTRGLRNVPGVPLRIGGRLVASRPSAVETYENGSRATYTTVAITKQMKGYDGADREWWLTGPKGQWLGFCVQARELDAESLSFKHLHYPKDGGSTQEGDLRLVTAIREYRQWECFAFYSRARPLPALGTIAHLNRHASSGVRHATIVFVPLVAALSGGWCSPLREAEQ